MIASKSPRGSPVPSSPSPTPTPTANTPGQNSGASTPKGSFSENTNASNVTTPKTSGLQRTLTFDHARCTDCSYGYLKTCDCTNHLNALQKQSTDANDRLQQLVEMRERVFEEAEKLIAQQGLDPSSIGAGSKSGSGSSFSEMFTGRKVESPSASPAPTPDKERNGSSRPQSPKVAGTNLTEGIASERVSDGVWKDAEGTEIDSNMVNLKLAT